MLSFVICFCHSFFYPFIKIKITRSLYFTNCKVFSLMINIYLSTYIFIYYDYHKSPNALERESMYTSWIGSLGAKCWMWWCYIKNMFFKYVHKLYVLPMFANWKINTIVLLQKDAIVDVYIITCMLCDKWNVEQREIAHCSW